MRSIETYVDAVVDKVCAMYSTALKRDLNLAQRRVVCYAMRMSFRNLTTSPLKQSLGTVHGTRRAEARLSRGISTDLEAAEPIRAHPRVASLR
jgi:hypothetical protein